MKPIKFTKMQGAGNDFIIIDNRQYGFSEEELGTLASKVCRRRLSIGADGLMAVDEVVPAPGSVEKDGAEIAGMDQSSLAEGQLANAALGGEAAGEDQGGLPGEELDGLTGDDHITPDFRMTYFNSDGSLGEMCGNGARCIARYGYEKGLAGNEMWIQVTAGLVGAERLDERNYRIRLNDVTRMEINKALEIPEDVAIPKRFAEAHGVKCGEASSESDASSGAYGIADASKEMERLNAVTVDYVELGSPGIPAIGVRYDGIGELVKEAAAGEGKSEEYMELLSFGRFLCHHPDLPKGANVNFYHIIGGKDVDELTYERGVEDFTFACGTGTGSMVSALTGKGVLDGKGIKVHVPGGTLKIDTITEDAPQGPAMRRILDLYLTGPTNIVSEGLIVDEDLNL